MNPGPFVRWLFLGCAVVIVSCKDALRPDATGSIALHVVVPHESAAGGPARSPAEPAGHLTSATATATSGSTTKTITLTGGTGSASFTGTITGLAPGTYTVTVQGFVATEVDYFGETGGVSVTANATATATVTFQSFVPTLNPFSAATTWSFRPTVNITSVPNATGYVIEVDRSNTFPNPTKTTVTSTTGATFVASDTGTHYVRVRAANTTLANGGRASSPQSIRIVTDLRASGTISAATNLGFGSAASITLDSLNIFPAADEDWFQLSECNGDSLSITAQAVRLSPGSPLNSVLAFYSGGTNRELPVVNQDDSTDARVRIKLTSDGTYKIRVSGNGTTVGHYRLQVQVVAGANNQGTSCKVQPLEVGWMSAGQLNTCAVRSDLKVDCWGWGAAGQIGNGGTSTTSSPTRISSSLDFSNVTVGGHHACGYTYPGGAAYCWGYNSNGQIGNGGTTNALSPTAVLGGRVFTQLSAGEFHTCGLSGTQIYCWGWGSSGQLGNGLTTDQSQPVLVSGGLSFQAVGAGYFHTCGLTTGGNAYCWGSSSVGQLGRGSTTSSNTPVAVSGGLVFVQLAVGAFHSCGRVSGGQVYCWGQNDVGQLGDGTATNALSPVLVSGGVSFGNIAVGRYHTCGLSSLVAYCWGNNYDGQLGDGTNTVRLTPTAVATASTFTSIVAGGWHTCAKQAVTSRLYCWGWNGVGQLGDGSAFEQTGPVAVSGGVAYNSITTGHQHTCAIRTSPANVDCWGYNFYGQVGDGSGVDRLTPVALSGGGTWSAVSGGEYHTCGLTGTLIFCWGRNNSGQLGNGTTTSSATPVQVTGGLAFAEVSSGDNHTCARTTGNAIYCWGENGNGQLGNNSTIDSPVPVAPSVAGTFRTISAGGEISCAVTTANAAYCWGNNAYGGLGNGSTTGSTIPVAVSGSLSFNSVTAGLWHACGLTTGNEIYCWGRNQFGQLGIGSTTNSTTPTKVSGSLTWKAVSASRSANACGIASTDVLYCWGDNFFGQLGDGTLNNSTAPKQVLSSLLFKAVQSGDVHTCGVTAANLAYCWGDNERGLLGNGTTTTKLTPVAVLTGPTSARPIASSELLPRVEARWMLDRSARPQATGRGPGDRPRWR